MREIVDKLSSLQPRVLNIIALLLIVLLAVYLRLQTLDWDQGQHLHPDERFLTMVTNGMQVPRSFAEYLDQSKSKFNPANIDFRFFVYGTFPLVITKLMAIPLGLDDYSNVTIFGRILSALFDLSSLVAIFLIVRILGSCNPIFKNPVIPLASALAYGISVLPIQLSHFYTTDIFTTTFLVWSFYFMLYAMVSEKRAPYFITLFISAVFFAAAIASKISAVLFAPLLGSFGLLAAFWHKRGVNVYALIVLSGAFYALTSYIGIRLFDPYLFEYPQLWNPTPSTLFLNNVKELQNFGGPTNTFPPNIQWISKTKVIFPLMNIIVAGVGVPLFLVFLYGLYSAIKATIFWVIASTKFTIWGVQKEDLATICIIGWIGFFFLYQGMQWVYSMRYFTPLYPFMAIFAGVGIQRLLRKFSEAKTESKQIGGVVVLFVAIFMWPYMFTNIYEKKHSRVIASEWIWKNLPDRARISWEHWDDPLPLQIAGINNKNFDSVELEVFPQDDDEKWKKLKPLIDSLDYYILSSNRASGTMPLVPNLYPQTKKFYNALLSERYKNFRLEAEFNSYPRFCLFLTKGCIDFPDQWLEEAFSVYDHPRVLIFKNHR